MISPRFLPRAVWLTGLMVAGAMQAAEPDVPEALKPWEGWARWGSEGESAPASYVDGKTPIPFWPSRLALAVEPSGGSFSQEVTVYAETWVPLPGSRDAWPQEVKVNNALATVIERDGRPVVKLPVGTRKLEGVFRWPEIPQSLVVPREVGLLALTLNGQAVESPTWDPKGAVWLKRETTSEEATKNFISVKVNSVLEDGIPLWWRSEVELIVSGQSREEDIGSVLPEGWKLAEVTSAIPVMVEKDGRLKAQVRAGRWTIGLSAFRLDNALAFSFAKDAKPAVTDELVAVMPNPELRMIDIVGASAVDISQTTFPPQWAAYPVYRWDTVTEFRIEERMRGMGQQKPEGLRISRQWWLDEDGKGLTFRDEIGGRMQQIWRLDAAQGQDLGAVRVDGLGQLITRNPQSGAPGVEIRARDIRLEATGRVDRVSTISATGWQADTDDLKVRLNLPPGWRLFALFGPDWVQGDWVSAWTLLDLFLLLVFTFAVFRLWGVAPAVLAFVAFALSYHEAGAPRYLWLALLIPLALLRVVPAGGARHVVVVWKWATVVALIFALVPFVARQVQQALYPQMETVVQDFSTGYAETVSGISPNAAPMSAQGDVTLINNKLDSIIIPRLDFNEATLSEAVAFVEERARKLDPEHDGVSIMLDAPEAAGQRITLSLTDISLRAAIRYVADAANLKMKVEPYGVRVVAQTEASDSLVTKEYRIPEGFIQANPGKGSPTAGTSLPPRYSTQGFLEQAGVEFPPGTSAIYRPESGKLIVKNTQDALDLVDSMMDASVSAPIGVSNNLAYDTKARIQTGPGVPDWSWRVVTFGWDGPVTAEEMVEPILIPVWLERTLSLLRVVLLLTLAAVLLNAWRWSGALFGGTRKVALLAIALWACGGASAVAQFPEQGLLDTLRSRLLKTSDAFPNAAAIPSVTLSLQGRKLVMEVEVHTGTQCAVPLPGRLPVWSPISVQIDGKPETSLRRNDGYLWLVLPQGVHRVRVEGLLSDATEWEWTFLLRPYRVSIEAPDWTHSGVKPDGVPEQQVFFALKQKASAGQASYDRQDYQSVAIVERNLELGLVWQVKTTVKRLSPLGKAVSLRIPLLPGENVLTGHAIVRDGMMEVRLGANEPAFTWESELSVADAVKLTTKADDTWVERWRLVASPVWNIGISGIAPIFEPSDPQLVPVWQPWPGESVELAISRPEAIAGATVTVTKAHHEIRLGDRQRVSQLNLSLLCSLGEDFLVELPAGAEVTFLKRGDQSLPVRKDGGKLIIPLQPGEQSVSIGWKEDTQLGLRAEADAIRLPMGSANVTTEFVVPESRWVLWTYGPLRGPAVQFWSVLVCALIGALVVGRLSFSPLRVGAWMLLMIGLTQVPLPVALFVVAWLFLLEWRGRESFQRQRPILYNLVQILIVAATAVSLGIFIAIVGEGLLGNPDMFIQGNGSYRTMLSWYEARSGEVLPQPGCLSVSTWWYRLLMLVWALWLAVSLIRWLRWGWEQFGKGGFLRRKEKPVATPPPLS